MAFTEAQIVALLDSAATGRTITLETFSPVNGGLHTDIFAIGVVAPFAGRSRWVQVAQTNTPAQAVTIIQNKLRE